MTQATIADAISHGANRLTLVAANPRLEARLLLAHALGLAQTDLIREPRRFIETDAYEHLLARREAYEPVAHIIGRREFWSMDFQVSNATLIPRADTETLIEAALAIYAGRSPPRRILDLGTGTGCLLLPLLREFPDAFGVGVDINPDAALLAYRNALRFGLTHRAGVICGDWTNAVSGLFDLIVANPPYVTSRDMTTLMPDVARYEPRLALDAGPDGGDAYRLIIPRLRVLMSADSTAILELGAGQAEMARDMAQAVGFRVSFRADLAGIARAAILTADDT